MAQRANEANVSFPAQVKVVDITLLTVLKELSDIEVERAFFADNPSKGQLIEWPIVGSLVDPNWLSDEERASEVRALNESYDDLPHRVPQLH